MLAFPTVSSTRLFPIAQAHDHVFTQWALDKIGFCFAIGALFLPESIFWIDYL